MKIISLADIKTLLGNDSLIEDIEQDFVDYSNRKAVIPPVGELLLEKGETHIKYGYIKGDAHYVIKIASGFYQNPALGLSSSNGLVLVFNQDTGGLEAILLDEGYLSDLRTAIAGAIAFKYLAPVEVDCIGILGTGIQAKLQLRSLAALTRCREVLVWGRHRENVLAYCDYFNNSSFKVRAAENIEALASRCQVIVTTTASDQPLLSRAMIQPGTHITCIGSDMAHKQEIDSEILSHAELVISDSIEQCKTRGEIFHALKDKHIKLSEIREIGQLISGGQPYQRSTHAITVADFTGLAVQDIKMAQAVLNRLSPN